MVLDFYQESTESVFVKEKMAEQREDILEISWTEQGWTKAVIALRFHWDTMEPVVHPRWRLCESEGRSQAEEHVLCFDCRDHDAGSLPHDPKGDDT